MENTQTKKILPDSVSERLRGRFYNEALKRFIYIEHKSNISKFAGELGVTRQCIWGIITGRLSPSISLAKRICDKLKITDTRTLFPDGTLEIPNIPEQEFTNEDADAEIKNVLEVKDEKEKN